MPAGRSYDYELCYIPCFGQSLSLGAGGVPALSLRQRFDSLMFSGGTIAQGYSSDLAADYATLVPLVENNNAPGFDTSLILYPGETPLSGAFEAVKELMASQDGLSTSSIGYRLLGSAPGQGGVGIAAFQQGTVPYQRLLYEVSQAKAIAASVGASFGVPALFWVQGESDGELTQPEYLAALQQLFTSLNADVLAITQQQKAVQFLTYQTASHGCYQIACAQFQLSQQQANVHVAAPAYPLQTQGDGTHMLPLSYKLLGAYFGSAYKRVVVNHDAWQPLSPASITASGNKIVVQLNVQPGASILADTFSTTTTSPIHNAYGFTLTDASGNALNIDGAVAITGGAQITITSPESVQAGFTLGYGNGGGNIRDNFGLQYVFNGGGLQQPMHNWLTVFRYVFVANAVTVLLTATPTVAATGATVKLQATVTPSLSVTVPTGSITFYGQGTAGPVAIATVALAAGSAGFSAPTSGLPPDTYSVTAVYGGDANYASSTSVAVPVTLT